VSISFELLDAVPEKTMGNRAADINFEHDRSDAAEITK
jgi:hypothetical protein